jgi:hypothetical protein
MIIDFSITQNNHTFSDALILADDHTFTDAEIEAMKQARFDNWYVIITAPTQDLAPVDEV